MSNTSPRPSIRVAATSATVEVLITSAKVRTAIGSATVETTEPKR